jgi:hypothetical protein
LKQDFPFSRRARPKLEDAFQRLNQQAIAEALIVAFGDFTKETIIT